jgi:hypothetical protein
VRPHAERLQAPEIADFRRSAGSLGELVAERVRVAAYQAMTKLPTSRHRVAALQCPVHPTFRGTAARPAGA